MYAIRSFESSASFSRVISKDQTAELVKESAIDTTPSVHELQVFV